MKISQLKKHSIDTDFISKEFDIENIDSLRDLSDKMIQRTYTYISLLEDLLQPDSIASMHEANFLRMHLTIKINDVYKKLMKLNRNLLLFRLNYEENKFKDVIANYIKSWNEIKPDLNIILTEMKDSWNKTVIHKNEGGYLGWK